MDQFETNLNEKSIAPANNKSSDLSTTLVKCRMQQGLFSWWTCMQYDLPLEDCEPRRVETVPPNQPYQTSF